MRQVSAKQKGTQFEQKIKALLERAGLTVETTPDSNDFGVDLLAEYDGYKIAFQCKYCKPGRVVGNQAVQEVVAGRACYHADKCVVVTNGQFTSQAVKQAEFNQVLLVDGGMLLDITVNEDGQIELFDMAFGSEYAASLCRAKLEPCVMQFSLSDLESRYGINRDMILKYLVPAGLPLVKQSGRYSISDIELRLWEEETGSVTYGRRHQYVLKF